MLKDKKIIVGIVVVVILLLLGGGFFVLAKHNLQTPQDDSGMEVTNLPKIDAKELGLTLIPSADKKYIQFKITNLKDIKHLEWEITYDADTPKIPGSDEGDTTGRVTQGFGGEEDIKSGQSNFTSDKRELGTCSTGGACRFDTGITNLKIVLKITKTDGKIYQSEQTATL